MRCVMLFQSLVDEMCNAVPGFIYEMCTAVPGFGL